MSNDIGVYSSASEMLAALRARTISSRELVQLHLDRIDERDGALNAIPIRTVDRALAAAAAADEARAAGGDGNLLGLPMTLKESTLTAGLPQTAGLTVFEGYTPAVDGPIATAVFDAGACLLGKTNIPIALGDWTADSPVYGRTNNPWDVTRTPGGSTGGGGAALAAGMTPLEVGSDIGGSVRVPAAYCGVYGHRPSETAVPRTGSFPPGTLPNVAALMGVQGPLARDARDLELLFDVMAGPEQGEATAWQLHLPAARHERLADFRVAIMPPVLGVQPSSAMQQRVDELAAFLRAQGATVGVAMPPLDAEQYYRDYSTLLTAITTQAIPKEMRAARAAEAAGSDERAKLAEAAGLVLDFVEFFALAARRETARHAWREFFRDWDVLVSPTVLDAAFPHPEVSFHARRLHIDGREVPYIDNIVYPMWAVFAGQPATAFPAGLSSEGLPLGLQAMGPYLEDRTTLRFAQLLQAEWHSFEVPPGY